MERLKANEPWPTVLTKMDRQHLLVRLGDTTSGCWFASFGLNWYLLQFETLNHNFQRAPGPATAEDRRRRSAPRTAARLCVLFVMTCKERSWAGRPKLVIAFMAHMQLGIGQSVWETSKSLTLPASTTAGHSAHLLASLNPESRYRRWWFNFVTFFINFTSLVVFFSFLNLSPIPIVSSSSKSGDLSI